MKVIKKKEDAKIQYDNYIAEHKQNVIKAYEWVKENIPDVLVGIDLDDLETLVNCHDASKTDVCEYTPYMNYFYLDKNNPEYVENFKYAWLHHIHNNPHHWNYWVLIDEDDGAVAMDMPDIYIVEMICDWWSFSWKKGVLTEILGWYDKHRKYMKLSKKTQNKVEEILDRIAETLR